MIKILQKKIILSTIFFKFKHEPILPNLIEKTPIGKVFSNFIKNTEDLFFLSHQFFSSFIIVQTIKNSNYGSQTHNLAKGKIEEYNIKQKVPILHHFVNIHFVLSTADYGKFPIINLASVFLDCKRT
jgi:hypothetical protein